MSEPRNPPLRLAQMLRAYLPESADSLSQTARDIGIDKSVLCRFIKGHSGLNGAALAKVLAWVLGPQERA